MADGLAEIPAQESVYGSWKSPITSDLIVQQSVQLKDVNIDPLDPGKVNKYCANDPTLPDQNNLTSYK